MSHHDEISRIHDYDLILKTREVFLFGREELASDLEGEEPGVEYTMANRLIRNLRILDQASDGPILLHMKSCGGDWMEGMAIYQAIRTCRSRVVAVVWTHARSMTSIILQACDYRAMMPYSHYMLHDGTFGMHGTVKQAYTEMEELRKAQEQMMGIYIARLVETGSYTERTARRWLRAQMDRKEEVYLDAHQTVEMGLADEVVEDYDLTRIRAAR